MTLCRPSLKIQLPILDRALFLYGSFRQAIPCRHPRLSSPAPLCVGRDQIILEREDN